MQMDRELKYLGFIRVIAINAVICLWKLYEYAKLKSGPFKSTIGTVESLVTAIVGPFYDRAKVLPDDVLLFLDNKVYLILCLFGSLSYFIIMYRCKMISIPS